MPRKMIDPSTPIDTEHFRWKVDRELVCDYATGDTSEVTHLRCVVHGFSQMDAGCHFSPMIENEMK
jgi:kynurenine formamidase